MSNVPIANPYQRVKKARAQCFPLTPDNLTVSPTFAQELREATFNIGFVVAGPHDPSPDCICDRCQPNSPFPYDSTPIADLVPPDPFRLTVTGLPAFVLPAQSEDFILRLGSTPL